MSSKASPKSEISGISKSTAGGGISRISDGANVVAPEFSYTLEEAFPELDPGLRPLGSRILVQIRRSRSKTKGGVILPTDTKQTDQDNMQIAKVLAVGPVAFKNRTTLEPWPEGQWVQPGEFVRVPKYGGDRVVKRFDGDKIEFAIFDDLNIIAAVSGDPLEIPSYI